MSKTPEMSAAKAFKTLLDAGASAYQATVVLRRAQRFGSWSKNGVRVIRSSSAHTFYVRIPDTIPDGTYDVKHDECRDDSATGGYRT